MTDAWQDILRVALVGTERQKPALPALPGAIGGTLAALPSAEPERALLGAAAVLTLYQSAGYRPADAAADGAAVAAPAGPERLPSISRSAAAFLPDLIGGQHAGLLSEWLAACAAAGLRVPHRYLPDLLDWAAANRNLREGVLRVVGERGRWLMNLNPAWNFDAGGGGVDDSASDIWQTGTRDQRLAFFHRLRESDPAAARGLARATWPQETPDDRALILATFDVRLSADDEPFLEECLDDRRKEVRTTASDLLARLPGSRLVARMVERLRPLIRVDVVQRGKVMKLVAGQPRKVTLDVTPPDDAPDKACVRDGVDPKPPAGSGMGEKAWVLQQMLAAVPPAAWAADAGATPDELLAAAAASEWHQPLLIGWTRAAARHPDPAWAGALLRHHLTPHTDKKKPAPAVRVVVEEAVGELVGSLPAPAVESAVVDALHHHTEKLSAHPALAVLRAHERPWGPDLSRAVLKRLRAELTGRPDYGLLWQWVQQDLGRRLAPEVAPEACDDGWDPPSAWENPVSRMRTVLQFRHDMLKSLVPPSP